MKRFGGSSLAASAVLLGICLAPIVLAHGANSSGEDRGHENSSDDAKEDSYPPTYFSHQEHGRIIYAHITLMVIAWVFLLPVAVMLSLAKSRFTFAAHCVFASVNALGVFLAISYNTKTPDLYPGNSHHTLGWALSWITFAQAIMTFLQKFSIPAKDHHSEEARGYEQHNLAPSWRSVFSNSARETRDSTYRNSNDSGQGSEPNTESLRGDSFSSLDRTGHGEDSDDENYDSDGREHLLQQKEYDENSLQSPAWTTIRPCGSMVARFTSAVSSRTWKGFEKLYNVIDRIILPLGFIGFVTGIAVFGRFFEGKAIFNGLAHWIKGGVFFWLGLLTLARWCGSFGDLGWAWNLYRARRGQGWCPSAEFVESALIFFYGSTNIFLEHLGGWGGQWTSQDFEHMSITVLFIGGGLCGMLVESTNIRDLLNTIVVNAARASADDEESNDGEGMLRPPETYRFSLNPIPALIILLLGVMMSSHHQASTTSTMVHTQWGNLLLGASFARGLTYVLVFLRPPQSALPSRPPTELLAAFGLIAGGVIFMASSADTVKGMIHYEMDAMSFYTVTMGFVGLLMGWVITVLAIKGWAVRREDWARQHRAA